MRRFVVHEITGIRMNVGAAQAANARATTDVAVHDSWYCYEIVAKYPSPLKGDQRLEKRRTLAREQAARLNRDFG